MRHRKKTIKLGRTSAHRKALLAGLVCSLIQERRIKTTLVKAKAARSLAEKMVTLGKKATLASRRLAISRLRQKRPVSILFSDIAPAFADRNGGYTRIIKLGPRAGDNAEVAILEWVNYTPVVEPKKKKLAKAGAAGEKPAKKGDKKAEGKKAEPKKSAKDEKTEAKKSAKDEPEAKPRKSKRSRKKKEE